MKITNDIIDSIIKEIDNQRKILTMYDCDLGDLGNIIGIVIGNNIPINDIQEECNSLLNGVKHGISLSNGTH